MLCITQETTLNIILTQKKIGTLNLPGWVISRCYWNHTTSVCDHMLDIFAYFPLTTFLGLTVYIKSLDMICVLCFAFLFVYVLRTKAFLVLFFKIICVMISRDKKQWHDEKFTTSDLFILQLVELKLIMFLKKHYKDRSLIITPVYILAERISNYDF